MWVVLSFAAGVVSELSLNFEINAGKTQYIVYHAYLYSTPYTQGEKCMHDCMNSIEITYTERTCNK